MGDLIDGIDSAVADGALVFHAATRREGDAWRTAGGRVLSVVAGGADLETARAVAERAADRIRWNGLQRRRDIGRPVAAHPRSATPRAQTVGPPGVPA